VGISVPSYGGRSAKARERYRHCASVMKRQVRLAAFKGKAGHLPQAKETLLGALADPSIGATGGEA